MQPVDATIAIVASLALVGSGLGLWLYEPPPGPAAFGVSYPVETVGLPELEEMLQAAAVQGAAQAETTLVHRVEDTNVSSLRFDLVVTGSATAPRAGTIEITVRPSGPDGTLLPEVRSTLAGSTNSVTLTIIVPAALLDARPSDRSVEADDAAAAYAAVAPVPGTNATGNWTLDVVAFYGQLSTGPQGEQLTVRSVPTLGRYAAVVSPAGNTTA